MLKNSAIQPTRNKAVIEALGSFVKHVTQPKTLWYKSKVNDLVLVEDASKAQVGFLSGYSALMRSINYGSLQFVYADKSDAKMARESYQKYLRSESASERASIEENPRKPVRPAGQEASVDSAQLNLEVSPLTQKPVQRDSPAQKGMHNAG